jgi:hypothetical protein
MVRLEQKEHRILVQTVKVQALFSLSLAFGLLTPLLNS